MKKGIQIIMAFMLIAMISVDCKKTKSEEITTGTIQGKIMSNGQPVPGAKVILDVFTVPKTPTDGFYKFENIEAGTYQMTVSKPGYITISDVVKLTAGETTTKNMTLIKMGLPIITDFNPKQGIIGTQVEIYGNNFDPVDSVNIVKFGTYLAHVISSSENKLIVIVPEIISADSVHLTVTVGEETATSAELFHLLYPWTYKKDYALDRISASFTIGKIAYLIKENSSTMLSYHAESDTWYNNISLPEGPGEIHFAQAIGDKAYAKLENYFWEFDPLTNSWTKKADFPGVLQDDRRWYFSMEINGNVYVGNCYNNYYFWEYNPVQNVWKRKADFIGNFSSVVFGNYAFSVNNKGYLGVSETKMATNTLWEYDPAQDRWTGKTPLPTDAYDAYCCFVVNQEAFVGLGHSENMADKYASHKIWKYDDQHDQWVKYRDCPAGMSVFASFSIQNLGYVAASYVSFEYEDKHFWVFDPSKN